MTQPVSTNGLVEGEVAVVHGNVFGQDEPTHVGCNRLIGLVSSKLLIEGQLQQ